MFGKGIPMVTTALALSSVKSRPSLTLPLHTAMSRAPSTTKGKDQINTFQIIKNIFTATKCVRWNLIRLLNISFLNCP